MPPRLRHAPAYRLRAGWVPRSHACRRGWAPASDPPHPPPQAPPALCVVLLSYDRLGYNQNERRILMLQHHLKYVSETGEFWWIKPAQGRQRSKPAGSVNRAGYVYICVAGKTYPAHRLAWWFYYGEWPSGTVDHINRNPSDNRIVNLRDATPYEQAMNAKRGRETGLPVGVDVHQGKYRMRLSTPRGRVERRFWTLDEAVAARAALLEEFNLLTPE